MNFQLNLHFPLTNLRKNLIRYERVSIYSLEFIPAVHNYLKNLIELVFHSKYAVSCLAYLGNPRYARQDTR